jgi:hypothetical protein
MPGILKKHKYRIKKLQDGGSVGDPIMSYDELKKHLGINYLPQATYEKWLESKGVTNLPGAEISTLSDESYDELPASEKRIYDLFETPEGTVQTSPVVVKTRGGLGKTGSYGRNPVAQIKHKGDIHWKDLIDMSRHVGLRNFLNYPSEYAKKHPEKFQIEEGNKFFRAHANPKSKTIRVPDADYNIPGDFYYEMVNDPDVAQWYKDKIRDEGREDQVYKLIAELSHLMPEFNEKQLESTIKSRDLRENLEGKYPDTSNYWMRDDSEYQSHFSPEGGEKTLYDDFVTFKGRGEDPNSPAAQERKRLFSEGKIYPQGITSRKKEHGGRVKVKKRRKMNVVKKYANGGSVGDPTGAFEDFIYGEWEEVGRSTDDAGVTTIKERRTGERDVEYSKRGVDWNVGYERWLAAGNKGSLADFKIAAERWKKSQSRKETDVQNRERTIEADKEIEEAKTSRERDEASGSRGSRESTDPTGGLETDIRNRKILENSINSSYLNDKAKRVKLLTSKLATSVDQPEISKELVKKSSSIPQVRPPGETLIEEDSTVGEVLPDSRVDSVTYNYVKSKKKNDKEKVKNILKEITTTTDDEGSTNLRLKVVNKGGKEKHKEVFEIYDSEGNLLAKNIDKTNILGNPVLRTLITDQGKEAGYAFGGRVIRINNKNRGKIRLLKK